jgi:hypothetical protein
MSAAAMLANIALRLAAERLKRRPVLPWRMVVVRRLAIRGADQ